MSRQALTRHCPRLSASAAALSTCHSSSTRLKATSYAMASKGQYHDNITTNHAGERGYCAMRGSCGPKDWTSKPLPCPSHEPASDVRGLASLSYCVLHTTSRRMLTAIYLSRCAAASSWKDQHVAVRTSLRSCETTSEQRRTSSPLVPHAGIIFASSGARSPARRIRRHSSTSPVRRSPLWR